MRPSLPPLGKKVILFGVALSGLLAVFSLYTRPDFMVTLANEVWSCF